MRRVVMCAGAVIAAILVFPVMQSGAAAGDEIAPQYPRRIEMPTQSGETIVYSYELIDSEEKAIFYQPYNVVVGNDGRQYWVDAGDDEIKVLDARNELLFTMGGEGEAPGHWADTELITPSLSPSGRVLVWDSLRKAFLVFDHDGSYQSSIRFTGVKLQVNGVAWINERELFIGGLSFDPGYAGHFIHRLRVEGESGRTAVLRRTSSFVEPPDFAPGLYYMLSTGNLALDLDGKLLYSASSEHRVEKYELDGAMVWRVSDPTALPDVTDSLDVTSEGRVRVGPRAIVQRLIPTENWIIQQVLRRDLMRVPPRPDGPFVPTAKDLAKITMTRMLELIDRSNPNGPRSVALVEANEEDLLLLTHDNEGRIYALMDFASPTAVRGVLSVEGGKNHTGGYDQ